MAFFSTQPSQAETFEDIVRVARDVCRTPLAVITIADEYRDRIQKETGFEFPRTALDTFFYQNIRCPLKPLIVEDLLDDERFRNLSFVSGPQAFRFFAGIAYTIDDEIVGTFSVMDREVRSLTTLQTQALIFLSRQIAERIEIHRIQRLRRLAEDQLEQYKLNTIAFFKMAALGELASGIAHEINNPLAAIMARAGQLVDIADQEQDPRQQIKAIGQQIERICLRMARTINSVKNFARNEEGEPKVDASVPTLIDTTIDICREKFKGDVRLEVSVSDVLLSADGVRLFCHPIQISQVLLNLLSNAHYAANLSDEKWVRINVTDHADEVEFSVTDSGPGIPTELRDKIMQPFFTTKPVGQGTGIGLSISAKIVNEHGGELSLDETSSETRFVFRLTKRER